MADFRDPELRVQFNPRHENAHNQVLQSFGEEGLVGVLLLLLPFGLATVGARRALRQRGQDLAPRQWPAAVGLSVVPMALLLNLQVGHALLENSVAYLVAVLLASAAALGTGHGIAKARTRRSRRAVPAVAVAALLGLAPALWAERPPLEGFSFGCFPWVEWPQSSPDRLLSTDARWLQAWGAGTRFKVQLRDGRPIRYREALSIDVDIDGVRAVEDFHPPRPALDATGIPVGVMRVDVPAGVGEGDLIEMRLRTTPPYAETMHYGTGRPWFGPSMGTPFFTTPARR